MRESVTRPPAAGEKNTSGQEEQQACSHERGPSIAVEAGLSEAICRDRSCSLGLGDGDRLPSEDRAFGVEDCDAVFTSGSC